VRVDDPFGRGVIHEFHMTSGCVATSGIGGRSWIGADGRPAHHLLDPSTGRPAFTGVVQATALAHTALDAEVRAKAALLRGPVDGLRWLAHGGVLVFDDGSHVVVEPKDVNAR
jgi:FAD:protein FMN transferase